MKAQRRFGLALSWSRLTVVFLVDIAILVIASHCPDSLAGRASHRLVGGRRRGLDLHAVSLVTHHGLTMTSGLAGWLWDWSADPRTTLAAGCTPAVDYQRRFGRDKVGVREYEGRLVTVIAVDGGEGHRRARATQSPSLLVQSVAAGIRQFDVHLDGIDIVSVQVRRGGNAAELSKLDKLGPEEWGLVSDQPASYVRRTWLVLRMNPQLNVAAVAARDSLASTLVAATERLAQDLDGQGCAARALTADEVAEVDSAVLADLEPTWSRPGWRYLKHFNGFATSFWLTPSDITTEAVDELWVPETDADRADHSAHQPRRPARGRRLGALPQRQPDAQGAFGWPQPAHRPAAGRGPGQLARPDESRRADRADPRVVRGRLFGSAGRPGAGRCC